MKKTIATCSLALAAIFSLQAFAEQYEFRLNADGVVLEKPVDLTGESCRDIQSKNPSMANGIYELNINGEKIPAYCNSGWTLVAAQFESNPVMWTGNMTNYDPSLASQRSFAIPENKLPRHTSFSVGKDLSIIYGATNQKYQTGDIPKTLVFDHDNSEYLIHRSTSFGYVAGNPDGSTNTTYPSWFNALVFEYHRAGPGSGGLLSTKDDYTWSFAPMINISSSRGYSMSGARLQNIDDSFAWTVWVK